MEYIKDLNDAYMITLPCPIILEQDLIMQKGDDDSNQKEEAIDISTSEEIPETFWHSETFHDSLESSHGHDHRLGSYYDMVKVLSEVELPLPSPLQIIPSMEHDEFATFHDAGDQPTGPMIPSKEFHQEFTSFHEGGPCMEHDQLTSFHQGQPSGPVHAIQSTSTREHGQLTARFHEGVPSREHDQLTSFHEVQASGPLQAIQSTSTTEHGQFTRFHEGQPSGPVPVQAILPSTSTKELHEKLTRFHAGQPSGLVQALPTISTRDLRKFARFHEGQPGGPVQARPSSFKELLEFTKFHAGQPNGPVQARPPITIKEDEFTELHARPRRRVQAIPSTSTKEHNQFTCCRFHAGQPSGPGPVLQGIPTNYGHEFIRFHEGEPSGTKRKSDHDTEGNIDSERELNGIQDDDSKQPRNQNFSEKRRRDRISERIKSIQCLVPNCNKTDKASILSDAADYIKFVQMQVKMTESMGGTISQDLFRQPTMQVPNLLPPFLPRLAMGMGMQFGMPPFGPFFPTNFPIFPPSFAAFPPMMPPMDEGTSSMPMPWGQPTPFIHPLQFPFQPSQSMYTTMPFPDPNLPTTSQP